MLLVGPVDQGFVVEETDKKAEVVKSFTGVGPTLFAKISEVQGS